MKIYIENLVLRWCWNKMSIIQDDYRYIWKILIEVNLKEISTKKINYYIPKRNISPYFELSDEDINFSEIGTNRLFSPSGKVNSRIHNNK